MGAEGVMASDYNLKFGTPKCSQNFITTKFDLFLALTAINADSQRAED